MFCCLVRSVINTRQGMANFLTLVAVICVLTLSECGASKIGRRRSAHKVRVRNTCSTVTQVAQELWDNDVNRIGTTDLTLNYQALLQGTTTDQSSQRLFSAVSQSKLSGRTYQTFLALLDNYLPTKDQLETLTTTESNENTAFLDAVLATKVSDVLLKHLSCRGIATSLANLRPILTKLWFDFYPRSGTSTIKDTSGFEHVMVGEYQSSTSVNGFHNWLSFYQKEKAGELNYHGYVYKTEPIMIGATFNWNNRMKTLGSFFIGVSPEFDIALYSFCFLTYPNKDCTFTLNGQKFYIKSYDKDGHIATAYVGQ